MPGAQSLFGVVAILKDPMLPIAVREILANSGALCLSGIAGGWLEGLRLLNTTGASILLVQGEELPDSDLAELEVPVVVWAGTAPERTDVMFLDRMATPDELIRTLLSTVEGRKSSVRQAATVFVSLTFRESQLVHLLSQGLKNKEIAQCLSIREGTVKIFLSRLFEKTGAKDRLELALFGLKNSAYGAASVAGPVPITTRDRRAMSETALRELRLVQPVIEGAAHSSWPGRYRS